MSESKKPTLTELLSEAPPHDIEAQMGVLGSLLLVPTRELFATVSRIIRPSDFYGDACRITATAIWLIHTAQKPVDITLVASHLRSSGDYERIGGVKFLAELSGSVPNAGHAEYYAKIVKSKAVLRRIIELATEAVRDAIDATDDSSVNVLQSLRAKVDQALSDASDDNQAVTLHEAAQQRMDLIDHPERSMLGQLIGTGIDCLDDAYGGFRAGGCYVIAARPGNGKSALMKQICNSLDFRSKPTLIVSLEMDAHEIAARILSERTGIDGKDFEVDENGECPLSKYQRDQVRDAVADSEHSVIRIHAPSGRNATMAGIAAFTRLMVARHGIKLVAIDYLQLIDKAYPRQTDYEKVTECSKACKQLARELGITVLLLSQLNRDSDKTGVSKQPRRPRLSDLRDSGAIEQDADGVIALHQVREHEPEFELLVLKWRNDAQGIFNVRLVGEQTMFIPAAIKDHPNYQDDFSEYAQR